MKLWIKYTAYLLWVVGLILLSDVAHYYFVHLKQVAESNFSMAPMAWFTFIVPFLLGIYFSILFVRSWYLRPNIPLLLCICLPTFLLSVWSPVAWTSIPHGGGFSLITVPTWVLNTTMLYIPQFVCGFTLLYGLLFSKSQQIQ